MKDYEKRDYLLTLAVVYLPIIILFILTYL